MSGGFTGTKKPSGNSNTKTTTSYVLLQVKAVKVTKNSVKISWKKVKGADGYLIYGDRCDTKNKKYSYK